MSKKLEEYPLEIKNGDPPERPKTSYDSKAYAGALSDIAKRIKPGQYVLNLSAGSIGKLKRLIKKRGGMEVRERRGQGESRGTLYVVTDEWLASHPDE